MRTIFVRATPQGQEKVTGLGVRDRLLRQLCAFGHTTDIVYLVSPGCSGKIIEILANEKHLQIRCISENIATHLQKSVGEHLCFTDNRVYLDEDIQAVLAGHKTEAPGMEIQANNHRQIENILLSHLSKPTDGIVSRRINRPLSTMMSRYLVRLGLPPVVFTFLTALIASLMGWVLFSGSPHALLLGAGLFQLASVVDGIDGEIARLTYQSSKRGARLDTSVDMMTNVLFFTGFLYALGQTLPPDDAQGLMVVSKWIIGLALLGIGSMSALLYFGPGGGSFDILGTTIKKRLNGKPFANQIFSNAERLFKRDFFALLFFILALFGQSAVIPALLLFGLVVWNLAIWLNAGQILQSPATTTSSAPQI